MNTAPPMLSPTPRPYSMPTRDRTTLAHSHPSSPCTGGSELKPSPTVPLASARVPSSPTPPLTRISKCTVAIAPSTSSTPSRPLGVLAHGVRVPPATRAPPHHWPQDLHRQRALRWAQSLPLSLLLPQLLLLQLHSSQPCRWSLQPHCQSHFLPSPVSRLVSRARGSDPAAPDRTAWKEAVPKESACARSCRPL